MTIKYTNILQSETLRNLLKFGIFGLKICHLATLTSSTVLAPEKVAKRKKKWLARSQTPFSSTCFEAVSSDISQMRGFLRPSLFLSNILFRQNLF
jgi:hypothetical protein